VADRAFKRHPLSSRRVFDAAQHHRRVAVGAVRPGEPVVGMVLGCVVFCIVMDNLSFAVLQGLKKQGFSARNAITQQTLQMQHQHATHTQRLQNSSRRP
jgi:hypothetical protein